LGGFAKYQEPITKASFAECLFSKIVHGTTFSLWSESSTLPFVRLWSQEKKGLLLPKKSTAAEKMSTHGVEQAFRLAVRSNQKTPSLRRRPSRSEAERPEKTSEVRRLKGQPHSG
jgi:hypothetical protein